MKGITGFRLRRATTTKAAKAKSAGALSVALYDQGAQDRVMAKIDAMGEAFYAMPESEYGDWLDALPQDEFFEFMSVMIELDDRKQTVSVRAPQQRKNHANNRTAAGAD
ncbi:hypothetical protein BLA13014_07597 [Burkholderia aenigmatica]|uniref:Uncharacterized protein n=1 Tax=Burkholderia aenigmatica TaxID=2015348 RepID=A0A6P2SN66_9BURK|nr:hypothetical protein [Burkholderia aenigmatica]VWC49472.1 hypothetical protein BLA13014_07597 [Burkholderia aenigmatica]